MKRNFTISAGVFLSFLFSGYSLAAETACDKPKYNLLTLPLEFVSTTPTPPIPANLPLGETSTYIYSLVNNSPNIIRVDPSIIPQGGSPSGDVTIDASSTCSLSVDTTANGGTCTVVVDIEPTVLGAASYILSAVFEIGGDPSCFVPVTADISYTAIPGAYAYITNGSNDSVTYCVYGIAGAFSDCADSGATGGTFDAPAGIAIPSTTFTGFSYAYVANAGDNTVSQCLIDSSTGAFDSCGDSGASTAFDVPTGITFYTVVSALESYVSTLYSYIVDNGGANVTQCDVSTVNGALSSCSSATASAFDAPEGIAVEDFGGATDYTYIVNNGAGTVTQCRTNGSGLLVNCFDSGLAPDFTFVDPVDIAFFESTDWYAYVTDSSANIVYQCTVDTASGQLLDCVTSEATGVNLPNGITFATVNSIDYAYVTDFGDNTLSVCTIDPGPGVTDGNLTCGTADSLRFSTAAVGLTRQVFNSVNYLYVTDQTNSKISQCKMYSPNGQIYCIDAGTGNSFFERPLSLVFNTNPGNATVYAYITDIDTSVRDIFRCIPNSTTGQLGSCVNAGPLGFSQPFDLTFATAAINSNYYVYISDQDYGTVFQCELDTDGTITGTVGALCNCTDAAQNLVSVPYSQISGVSYQAFTDGPFVYVADEVDGQVYRCTVDAGVSGTGLFTACTDSGAGSAFTAPADIAFQAVTGTTYVYVTAQTASEVNKCTVNTTTGVFSACTDYVTPEDSLSITFDAASPPLYAYISTVPTTDGFTLNKCSLGAAGAISSCVTPFGNPTSLAVNNPSVYTGTGSVGYITQLGGSGLAACLLVNADGTVGGCFDSGTGFLFSGPSDVIFGTYSAVTYAYIADADGHIYKCTWNSTSGVLSACAASSATFTNPDGIAFSEDGTHLYVTSEGANIVSECSMNSVGVIGSCVTTGSIFETPADIVFGDTQAYITDQGNDSVIMCDINSSGLLTACVDSGATDILTPNGITLYEDTNSVTHAYITNDTASGGVANSVTSCVVDGGTGLLSACTDSGVTDAFDLPYGIAFQAFDGTPFAYVTNSDDAGVDPLSNTVSKCEVDDDGVLSTCVDSGAGDADFDGPQGIAFFPSVTN